MCVLGRTYLFKKNFMFKCFSSILDLFRFYIMQLEMEKKKRLFNLNKFLPCVKGISLFFSVSSSSLIKIYFNVFTLKK